MQFPKKIRNRNRNRNRNRKRNMVRLSEEEDRFNKKKEELRRGHVNRGLPVEEEEDGEFMKGLIKDMIVINDDEENDYDEDLDLQMALFVSCSTIKEEANTADRKKKGIAKESSSFVHREWDWRRFQAGESSVVHCVICNDTKPPGSVLEANTCGHPFCPDCIENYIKEKIKDDVFVIKCPEARCKHVLEQNFWQQFIPQRLGLLLEDAFIEGKVLAVPRLYRCPFEDCLELVVNDQRQFLIRACPYCSKIFCARCMASWHQGMTCCEYKLKLKSQEILKKLIIYIL